MQVLRTHRNPRDGPLFGGDPRGTLDFFNLLIGSLVQPEKK